MNTVLPTGPGIWELRANQAFRPSRTVELIKALPSLTHMSLVKLHEVGLVKATVSQNVDGLHRRSGLRPSELAELHGNTNLETCSSCSKQYLRDFKTRCVCNVQKKEGSCHSHGSFKIQTLRSYSSSSGHYLGFLSKSTNFWENCFSDIISDQALPPSSLPLPFLLPLSLQRGSSCIRSSHLSSL